MSVMDWIGLVLSLGIAMYLVRRAALAGEIRVTAQGLLQVALYVGVLVLLAKPLGAFMARCTKAGARSCRRCCGRSSASIYRVCGRRREARESDWKRYAVGAAARSTSSASSSCIVLQRLQGVLPLNPAGLAAVVARTRRSTPPSASPPTRTGRATAAKSTMSYLTQMLGLAVQNFVSAATGMAVLVALIRGFARRQSERRSATSGSISRARTLYILLPLSLVLAIVLVSQGVVQTFSPYRTVDCVEPVTIDSPSRTTRRARARRGRQAGHEATQVTEQTLPLGPAASQIAIKQLGTNGGGFFNVNSAHPFENPTPLSNFLEMLVDPADPRGALLHLRSAWSATRARAGRCSPRCS